MNQGQLLGADAASFWKQAVRLFVFIALCVLGFVFSMLAFVVIAVGMALIWSFYWWKTRKIRQVMREQAGAAPHATSPYRFDTGEGRVIEGEVVEVQGSEASSADEETPRQLNSPDDRSPKTGGG